MTDQPDLSELKTFADWCRAIDRLPAEAKRTVEALLYQLEGHLWAKFANQALWLEWKEWQSERRMAKQGRSCETQNNCELADRILSTCHFLETRDWGGYSFQLTDLRPLTGLTHIIRLDLNGNCKGEGNGKLCDLTPLTALTNLLELNLCGNAIADLSLLAELTSLIELDLSSNQITDITPLAALTELTVLDLSENAIADLSPLAALKDLTSLSLSNNHLTHETDFSPLLALTKLTDLSLDRNQITDRTLEMIAELTTLESLNVSRNRITDISPLTTLPNLIHLDS